MQFFSAISQQPPFVKTQRSLCKWEKQQKHRNPILLDHTIRYLKLIKSVRLSVEALAFNGSFKAFALF